MKPVKILSKQILTKVIEKDEYAVGALIHIYNFQTADEKRWTGVSVKNEKGFSSADSGFANSLSKQFLSKGRLTTRQLDAIKKFIPKYHKQIDVLSPLSIKKINKRIKKIEGKEVTLEKDNLVISFPFDPKTVAQVKLLSNRTFKRTWKDWNNVWVAPITISNIDDLAFYGFELCPKVKKWANSLYKKTGEIGKIPGLRAELYPYQKEGVAYLESRNGRAIISDEMGLGKTIQSLSWVQLNIKKDVFPVLVICTSSTKLNWAKEVLKFTDLSPAIIEGRKEKRLVTFPGYDSPNIFIANYDIIYESFLNNNNKKYRLDKWLKEKNFKTVITDESQYLKNSKTGRTVAAKQLSKSCNHFIALSGTPIENRPVEFFNIINMINSQIFPNWWKYTSRYCDAKNNGFARDVSGASNTEELHRMLSSIMIRRLKKDVLTELPPKVRSVIPIQIDKKKYDRVIKQARIELEDDPAAHLSIIEKAKQTVVELKMRLCLEWIQNYIDNDEKLVVFADHRNVIEEVHNHFKKESVVVFGGTAANKRQQAVDSFQKDPNCRIFIGSKSAKEGITLTAAKATCFLELWWEPGSHDQAEDRVHRIGQKADSVMTYYLLAEGTIEEYIAQLLDEKRKVLAAVLDGKVVEDKNMLVELMKHITEENNNE